MFAAALRAVTRKPIIVFSQIRAAEDKLPRGHASGDTHGGRAGRSSGPKTMAVRRLLQRCGTGEQDGKQWPAWVSSL